MADLPAIGQPAGIHPILLAPRRPVDVAAITIGCQVGCLLFLTSFIMVLHLDVRVQNLLQNQLAVHGHVIACTGLFIDWPILLILRILSGSLRHSVIAFKL